LMILTNLIQAVVILCLLPIQSGDSLWLVYVVFLIETSLAMFFEPAEGALLPHLVDRESLLAANGMYALSNNLARLVGPLIGALLIVWFGMYSVALFDAASFLISAVLIGLISHGVQNIGKTEKTSFVGFGVWREWREGLQLIQRDPAIMSLIIVWAVTSFGGAMLDPLIAPWVQSVLQGGADLLAGLSTAGAIGGILAGVLLSRVKDIRPAHFVGAGNTIGGLMLLAMYNLTFVPAILVLACIKSIPLVATGAGLQTTLQTTVPDSHRGRIYGALNTTNGVVGLAALAVSGFLGEIIGIVPMLSVAASVTVFAGILALLLLSNTKVRAEADEIGNSASAPSE